MPNLKVIIGDITTLAVDAIVNAANSKLAGGGGVDGAIHRAAGPQLLEDCLQLGGCPTGEAKLTKGYQLPAKYVIHAVGPIWQDGLHHEAELLACCYRRSLEIALEHQVTSIAFPAISCGIYRFPLEQGAKIAVTEVCSFLEQNQAPAEVTFACFNQQVYNAFAGALEDQNYQ